MVPYPAEAVQRRRQEEGVCSDHTSSSTTVKQQDAGLRTQALVSTELGAEDSEPLATVWLTASPKPKHADGKEAGVSGTDMRSLQHTSKQGVETEKPASTLDVSLGSST
jgi:hypothetical protein